MYIESAFFGFFSLYDAEAALFESALLDLLSWLGYVFEVTAPPATAF